MELTWINKLRIAAVAALGIVVIGVLAWPLAAPADPLHPVRAADVGWAGTLLLLVLSFGIGLAGYFISWPHGREIGILGVPFGLAVWAGRSGPMRILTQAGNEPAERAALLQSLRAEPVYWLLFVAAGFAGVLVAQHLRAVLKPSVETKPLKSYLNVNTCINGLIALVVAVLVSQFFVGAFTQDLTMPRHAWVAQPTIGQILFGVTCAFGAAAFIIKKFLDLSYIWSALASVFVIASAQAIHYNAEVVQRFAEAYPATSFPHSVFAVLPVQLVALGSLGSVLGFWLAVRYDYWRKHEMS